MLGFSVYLINNAVVENDPAWEVQIKTKCPDYFEKEEHTIERFYTGDILVEFCNIGYAAGAFYGLVLQHICFDGMSRM